MYVCMFVCTYDNMNIHTYNIPRLYSLHRGYTPLLLASHFYWHLLRGTVHAHKSVSLLYLQDGWHPLRRTDTNCYYDKSEKSQPGVKCSDTSDGRTYTPRLFHISTNQSSSIVQSIHHQPDQNKLAKYSLPFSQHTLAMVSALSQPYPKNFWPVSSPFIRLIEGL